MTLTKFLKVIVFVTFLSLIYTHMQTKIFDLAYQGKDKEQRIKRLKDENRNITCNILALKSSSYLGVKLLSDNSDMQFGNRDRIITLRTKSSHGRKINTLPKQPKVKKKNFLISLFSLRSQAEAKSIK